MAGGKGAIGSLLGIVLLICVWASCANATTIITAQTPFTFTAHCTGYIDGEPIVDFGDWPMSTTGHSSLSFVDDHHISYIICVFDSTLGAANTPAENSITVFTTQAPCVQDTCQWIVLQDGFYTQDVITSQLSFVAEWDTTGGTPPTSA
ncbi:unnamed protein product [Calypogeia fissa]